MQKNIKFFIHGIHCASCKTIIESEIKDLQGIKNIKVDYKTGEAEIDFDDTKTNQDEIFDYLKKINYQPSEKKLDKVKIKVRLPLIALALIALGYGLLNYFNAFELLARLSDKDISLGLIFLIGLLSGFHCIGMCGGLVVAYSTKQKSKYRSHLHYNLGRIISYSIIGGILGGLGSFFGINPTFTGTITILAGLFMIMLGVSYISKWSMLEKLKIHTPEFITKLILNNKNNKKFNTPLVFGLLTGFMPCGPLQAIQLYALTTGNAIQGALSLGIFALGTSLVMFTFGLIISSLTKNSITKIAKISGFIVIVLGIIMINRGLSNFNFSLLPISQENQTSSVNKTATNFQEVRMELNTFGYEPNVLNIKPEIPVRWIIDVKKMSGCTNAIMIESLGIKQDLKYGENIIEFTPPKNVKEIKFSCWMRMVWGKFIIGDQTSSSVIPTIKNADYEAGSTCSTSGSGCGSASCGGDAKKPCACGN